MDSKKHGEKLREISLKEDKTKGYGRATQKFVDPFLPRFKVITFKKGEYLVVDRYTGEELNIGQAITYFRKRPVYGLNYYGILLDKKFKAKEVFNFLKKALQAGAGKSAHRGLDGFKEGYFNYKNRFNENRGFVEGEENIYYKKKLIYIQTYHGGLIEDSRDYKEWIKRLLPSKELLKKLKF